MMDCPNKLTLETDMVKLWLVGSITMSLIPRLSSPSHLLGVPMENLKAFCIKRLEWQLDNICFHLVKIMILNLTYFAHC